MAGQASLNISQVTGHFYLEICPFDSNVFNAEPGVERDLRLGLRMMASSVLVRHGFVNRGSSPKDVERDTSHHRSRYGYEHAKWQSFSSVWEKTTQSDAHGTETRARGE